MLYKIKRYSLAKPVNYLALPLVVISLGFAPSARAESIAATRFEQPTSSGRHTPRRAQARSVRHVAQMPMNLLYSTCFPTCTQLNAATLNERIVLPQPYFVPVIDSKNEKSEWEKPATWISLFALVISLSLAGYTIKKDSKARRHSILDDYWFRKVVGPVTVEPLLKQILELIAAAPCDDWDDSFDPKRIRKFHDDKLKALSELAVNAYSLQLIEDGLGSEVAAAIDEIQDSLIAYCSSQAKRKGTSELGQRRSVFQAEARTKLFDILAVIKKKQANIR